MILAMCMFTYRHFITGRQSITRQRAVPKPEKREPVGKGDILCGLKPEINKGASAHDNMTGNNINDKKSIQ